MACLLHVSASPRGDASVSRQLGRRIVAALAEGDPALDIRERDLAAKPPPHPDATFVAASLMPETQRSKPEQRTLALSERLIGEVEAADIVVLSTPMHNFTVPSALKAWLDHLVRPGRTFRSTPAGKVGLLADRPVLVAIACGSRVGEDAQRDFLSPYLRYVLGTIGLRSVELLRLEGLGRTAGIPAGNLQAVQHWIGRWRTAAGAPGTGGDHRDRVVIAEKHR